MDFGVAIRTCREARGMSRAKLAMECDISPSYITLLEQNKRDPNLSVVNKISKALDVPPSILMFLASDKDTFESFDKELAEKMALTTLKIIQNAARQSSPVQK